MSPCRGGERRQHLVPRRCDRFRSLRVGVDGDCDQSPGRRDGQRRDGDDQAEQVSAPDLDGDRNGRRRSSGFSFDGCDGEGGNDLTEGPAGPGGWSSVTALHDGSSTWRRGTARRQPVRSPPPSPSAGGGRCWGHDTPRRGDQSCRLGVMRFEVDLGEASRGDVDGVSALRCRRRGRFGTCSGASGRSVLHARHRAGVASAKRQRGRRVTSRRWLVRSGSSHPIFPMARWSGPGCSIGWRDVGIVGWCRWSLGRGSARRCCW